MSTNNIFKSQIQTDSSLYLQESNKLGSGTYGTVFKGVKVNSNENAPITLQRRKIEYKSSIHDSPVAIKTFRTVESYNDELTFSQKATEEGIPHAIRHRDQLKLKRSFSIMMDEVPSPTLNKTNSKLVWTDILTITLQLMEFIHKLDSQQIVHGDLKPSNLIYEMKARYLTVLDFGLAKKSSSQKTLNFNGTFEIVQTIGYRAPEIMLKLAHTTSVDIWSMGCIIYEIVTKSVFIDQFEYWDAKDEEIKREFCIQKLFSLINLPSVEFVNQLNNSNKKSPWIVKNNRVEWKKQQSIKASSWEKTFREKALGMQAPQEEIEVFVSILRKIFKLEGRASIGEIYREFGSKIRKDTIFHISDMDRFDKLTIVSNGVSTVIDNSLRVHRSCVHVFRNFRGPYLMTLENSGKIIIKDYPIFEHRRSLHLSITDLKKATQITPPMEELFPSWFLNDLP